MQFTCSTKSLIEALQIATKALSNRTTNQILEGVLLETDSEQLTITCSDERITIVTSIDANVSQPGRGVVPGKLFSDIVRRLPDETVDIKMDNRFVFTIRSASSRMNISGQDADLFPRLPKMDDEREISLPQDMLRDMITKTEFAIAQDDMREVLTGCLLEVRGGDAIMVALDGFRLAMIKNACADVTSSMSAIIPGRAVSDIGKLLKDGEDDFCVLSFEKNRLHINLMGTDIYVVLIEGEYIDYRRILPNQFATRVVAELEPMRRAVERAALIARESSNNRVRFVIEDGRMNIESNSEIGDVHEEMEVEQQGGDITITFNVKYMQDVMRIIESDRIELNMNTHVTPCVITPVDNRDYLHLVLPVRERA